MPTEFVNLRLLTIGLNARGVPVADICREFRIPKSTAYRWINEAETGKIPSPREFAVRIDHWLCSHRPINIGETTVCVECCKSGFDHRPEFNPRPLPPERKPSGGKLRGGKND